MESPIAGRALLAARLIEACLLLAVAYRVGRTADRVGQAMVFGLACAATLVLGPIARGHYYVLMLPAVMFLSVWLVEHDRPRLALWAAVAPAVLVWAHFCLMGIAGRIGLLGIGTAIWLAAAAICVLQLEGDSEAGPTADARLRRVDRAGDASAPRELRGACAPHHVSSTELSR
jgi:hypothetical protein